MIRLFAFFLLGLLPVGACDIPVFRYGLDYWPADDYRLETTAAESDPFPSGNPHANLFVETNETATASRLLFPDGESVAWTGEATPQTLAGLVDSPARAEIAKRILAGQSAVWIYVESGDAEKDDAAVGTVETRLKYIESIAELPEIDPTDPANKMGPGPELRIGFSLLRIPADSPEEELFLESLRGPEGSAGDAERPRGGFFVPVFGRGRALALILDHEAEDATLIDDACLFLLGACSCQAKNLNPGWDLLMNINWTDALEVAGVALASNSAAQPVALTKPETVTISADQSKTGLDSHVIDGGRWTFIILGAALASLLIGAVYFLLRKKS